MRGGAAMIPEFSVPVEAPATGDGGLDVPDFLR
jgi:hypothetical protein